MKKSVLFTATIVLVLVFCMSFGVLATPAPLLFPDVDEDSWYGYEVNNLAMYGCINGYPDGTFRPTNNVTRAEFAQMLALLFDGGEGYALQIETGRDPDFEPFSDVEEGDWYYEAVMMLSYCDLINGYPDGTFKPNDNISREEMAYMLYRFGEHLFGYLKDGAPPTAYMFFEDVLADRWSAEAIDFLTGVGIIRGYGDNTFRPTAEATRAEAAVVIYRFYD